MKIAIGDTVSFTTPTGQALAIITGYQPVLLNGKQHFGQVKVLSSNGETTIDERRIIQVIDNGLGEI